MGKGEPGCDCGTTGNADGERLDQRLYLAGMPKVIQQSPSQGPQYHGRNLKGLLKFVKLYFSLRQFNTDLFGFSGGDVTDTDSYRKALLTWITGIIYLTNPRLRV